MISKKIIVILLVLFGIFGVLFLVGKARFPVDYLICGAGYTDCFTVAKFDDMRSCQNAVEKGGWSCDQTNPNDIRCSVVINSEAVAYCKD